jgi:hypothetical protein
MKYRGDFFHALTDPMAPEGPQEMSASALDILFRHHGRRPFITSEGHLGLGPAAMQRGDVVVVILGAELPFIFRKEDKGRYSLVGEAYVDGIMDGEILQRGSETEYFDIV